MEKKLNRCPKCRGDHVSLRVYAGARLVSLVCCECKHESSAKPELADALSAWNGGIEIGVKGEDVLFE